MHDQSVLVEGDVPTRRDRIACDDRLFRGSRLAVHPERERWSIP